MASVDRPVQKLNTLLKELGYDVTVNGAIGAQNRTALVALSIDPSKQDRLAEVQAAIQNVRDSGVTLGRDTLKAFDAVQKVAAPAAATAPAATAAATTPAAPAAATAPAAPDASAPAANADARSSAYRVERGDTVGRIAAAWKKANPESTQTIGQITERIITDNNIRDKSGRDCRGNRSTFAHIEVGQELRVPEGRAISGVEKEAQVCVAPARQPAAPAASAPAAATPAATPRAEAPRQPRRQAEAEAETSAPRTQRPQATPRPAAPAASGNACVQAERDFNTLAGTEARVRINGARHNAGQPILTDPQRGNQADCRETVAVTRKVKDELQAAVNGERRIRPGIFQDGVLTHRRGENPLFEGDRTISGVRQTGAEGRPDIQTRAATNPQFRQAGRHYDLAPESPAPLQPNRPLREQLDQTNLRIVTIDTCKDSRGRPVQIVGLPGSMPVSEAGGGPGGPGASPGGTGGPSCGSGGPSR